VTAEATGERTVVIATRSPRDELISVVRAGMAISAGIWLYLANNPFPETGTLQRSLLPYQKTVATLEAADQRMFRELQVALLEAETLRSTEGQWPVPERLAGDGIEPFAPNPTDKGPSYKWQLVRSGFLVNYLGLPSAPGAPAWLLVVQEPDPRGPPDVFQDDQEHHKLIDGTILHVSVWQHADGERVAQKPVPVPQGEGWTQLYAVDPREVIKN
jgi:hypothetical protein